MLDPLNASQDENPTHGLSPTDQSISIQANDHRQELSPITKEDPANAHAWEPPLQELTPTTAVAGLVLE
jgi:hypothetical protein